jgi:hypothetical protein
MSWISPVDVMLSGLMIVLLGFSSYFGPFQSQLSLWYCGCLGIFSSVGLGDRAMRVWTGPVAGYAFDFVTMATYHCCVVIWMVYLLAPETARSSVKGIAGECAGAVEC